MRIVKGIKGIRQFLAEDKSGWHVFINDVDQGFYPHKVSEVFANLDQDVTFIGWTGNVLSFTRRSV